MRLIAMGLLISSIILIFSGCMAKPCPAPQVEYVNVPQKCVVPYTEEPVIDNAHYETYPQIVVKALQNYTAMKEYAMKLKVNSEVCR